MTERTTDGHLDLRTYLVSRRRLLRGVVAVGTLPVLSALAAACGGGEAEEDGSGQTGATSTTTGQAGAQATPQGSAGGGSGTPASDAFAVEGYDDPTKWAGRQLVFVSWGGALQDSEREAFLTPFSQATGAEVIDTSQPSEAQIKTMVETGNVEWDVVETYAGMGGLLSAAERYLEPIDYNVVDKEGLIPELVTDYYVPNLSYSTVIAYRTDKYSGDTIPQTWADFWDLERFPGARSLWNGPQYNLEAALMADGVAPEEVYQILRTPEGVDRAFQKLDEIKDSVLVWWESGAQPAQLLTDGEADLVMAWHGRITTLAQEGVPVAAQFNQGLLDFDIWVVPKGAPNKDVAMDFINFATRPGPQAHFATIYEDGPINELAYELLSEDRFAVINTGPELSPLQIVLDFDFWVENSTALTERFNSWLIS